VDGGKEKIRGDGRVGLELGMGGMASIDARCSMQEAPLRD